MSLAILFVCTNAQIGGIGGIGRVFERGLERGLERGIERIAENREFGDGGRYNEYNRGSSSYSRDYDRGINKNLSDSNKFNN